jgi:hypothetical protein
MKQIKEVFSDHSEALAHLIQEANRALATDFGINQSNNPKHPSFCEKTGSTRISNAVNVTLY